MESFVIISLSLADGCTTSPFGIDDKITNGARYPHAPPTPHFFSIDTMAKGDGELRTIHAGDIQTIMDISDATFGGAWMPNVNNAHS